MVDKKTSSVNVSTTSSATEELSQLRKIVFGEAKQGLEQQLANLQRSLDQGLSSLHAEFSDKLQKFQDDTDKRFAEAEDRLQYVDKQHDDKEDELHKALNNLGAEHDSFSIATDKNLQQLNDALDNESSRLSEHFEQQISALKSELEKVSNELHSSKTDRKTLAKLLATMATNLEDDDQ
ncbi:hypothetical protein QX776_00235 [Alteromonadaceae bacterium BrNp21-10]|nr:hypothetical protein [Alteromonadaceae bacterium BrNp21-10]